jgi:hypothetical protein
MPSIAFGRSNGEDPAVISTSGLAEFYFDNRTDLPITLCPRITSLDAQPAGAWNSRAGRLHPLYASSEAVKRGCGTLGGDYSAALASELAGFRDWAHGATRSRFSGSKLPLQANATMAVRDRRPIRHLRSKN